MPNWCENNLSIYGKIEDMQKIMEIITIEDGQFSLLETLYPTPDELMMGNVPFVSNEQMKENAKKYGFESWYDWRIAHWGCKWPESSLAIGQEYTKHDDGTAVIAFNFETAWAPPIEAFDKISEDYPNLLFCLYYQEPGMGFCGTNVWANGEQVESTEAELVSSYFDEEYLFDKFITTKNN